MKFKVTKSSDWRYIKEVEINNLEEMEDFQLKARYPIIVSFKSQTIEIYNDYRES